jgi:translation initiation factor 5B
MTSLLKVTSGPGNAVVLEVKEEPGLGTTLNSILYSGDLKVNSRVVLGGRDHVINTRVRAILVPKPLDEIRDPRDRFNSVDEVHAAAGVKIAAPGLDDALAGSPLYVVPDDESPEKYIQNINQEVTKLRIKTDKVGLVVKADTLGSLEAIINTLKKSNVPIRLADVGDVSKRDVVEAETVKQKSTLLGAILCFNVKILPDAKRELTDKGIPIFDSNIVYRIIEEYKEWAEKERLSQIKAELDILIRPGKLKILPGYVFRISKPAIVGVEILNGTVKPHTPLISSQGRSIGKIVKIQDKGVDITEAIEGSKVAISIDEGIVGRNLDENDLLLVNVPSKHMQIWIKKFKDELAQSELEVLEELKNVRG